MQSKLPNRHVRYCVQDGCLVRTVSSDAARGRDYVHRCDRKAFEAVAHAVAQTPDEGQGTTLTAIARQEGLPYTQVNVALEFLKERGVVEVRGRRSYPAATDAYLDAMVEFHAPAEALKSA